MRHQVSHRSRKSPVIVDEDCGIPTAVIDNYRESYETGPLGPPDPRTLLLSMSEYDKPQSYDVYEYNTATRPEQAQDYAGFASHPSYAPEYVGSQAQVPSGLPQSTGLSLMPSTHQQYGTHDPAYYSQQQAQYPAYLDPEARQLPEVLSYTPAQGQQGTRVTVYFTSNYDLENPPASIVMMFGHKRCDSVLSKTSHQGPPYQYALSADAPSLSATNSPSPQLPLHLSFEGSTTWQSPTLDFGQFTYFDQFPVDSPTQTRKRKLTPETSERRSPTKKSSFMQQPMSRTDSQSYYQSAPPSTAGSTDYSRSSISDPYGQSRRFSVPEINYSQTLPRVQTQQYYGSQPSAVTARLQTGQSPYNYYSSLPSVTRSPSTAGGLSAGARSSQLLPSPSGGTNPPLIRTSTIQASPTTPGSTTQSFNPYAMYPANTKAMLKIEGDLNSMTDNWTPEEWESKRRLVQFRRSQAGSVISATFEPVSPEERAPNSICVSCIYWAEKNECYVTSVDTIQLLESLVAVRFTVEEKNRIRRNLEGFRPATVSKTKLESEEFFKLIMLFPAPKPRNIEKDVKVFPWRILATALKKIIGKYASHPACGASNAQSFTNTALQSASYSSTAGALHQGPSAGPSYPRGSDVGQSQRQMITPMTTASSTPHAYATAMTSQAYAGGSAGLGVGPSAGPPDLRLTVPGAASGQTASWHQPSAHYSSSATDLSGSASAGRGGSWDFGSYLSGASPATGLPGSAQAAQYQYGLGPAQTAQHQRIPSLAPSQASHTMNEGRFLPLYEHDDPSQQTSGA